MREDDDDSGVTLRLPRSGVAAVVAVCAHVVALLVIQTLPEPKKPEERIEMTVQSQSPKKPPPPPSSSPPPTPPKKKTTKSSLPPPTTSPVQPVLPPQETPSETRAVLPPTETSPEPAPPPQPSSWRSSLLSSLAETTPKTTVPTGVLAPSFRTLQAVANNDMRLHDDEREAEIAENFGPFFRRGIEALRRTWHPEDALLDPEVRKRCQTTLRTTQAVATLDRDGTIVDVEVKRGSGCPELDAEAVKAWRLVAQLPHPPKGLFVLPDGTPTDTARMPVRFIVSFDGGLRLTY